MIIKNYEIDKIDVHKINVFLLYGENEGYKNQIIEQKLLKNVKNYENYEEKEIIENYDTFIEGILNKSFFEKEKNIIISRVTDKSYYVIEELIKKKIDDVKIVLKANKLDKKSKIRLLIEKDKNNVCIPFYADELYALNKLATNFFRENKIQISREAINIIVEKCQGDRKNLQSELFKIKIFLDGKNKIDIENVVKLVNLYENFGVSELIDNCLVQNKNKTAKILNENNYSHDDCMLILRTLLSKVKRIYKILLDIEDNFDMELSIKNFKPSIFWKDKEIVKKQIQVWNKNEVEILLKKINEIELVVKKNSENSLNIVCDFLLNIKSLTNNKI